MKPKDQGLRLPELLAPAGSPAAFRAAIAAGADAVYLSGRRFGARKFAPNFSDDEIRDAIRSAHARNVRVYVTVNTLVHDRELTEVAEYLYRLYRDGADAILLQDAGVASLARTVVPGLPLHASTQMTVHNTAGVIEAAEAGFVRVVLARELPLAEIRMIAKKTGAAGIGLEVFAHGALCDCYSGQCLLSSLIGGRSGNRGACAQPCRKPYALVCGGRDRYGRPENLLPVPAPGPYLLSPKDLCTYRHLPELVESPVAALKIEGRMRSPEYVAIVVSAYRQALDAIFRGEWEPDARAERDLLLAFNRGFTKGYLFGDRGDRLMARDAPDNRGIAIGTVTAYDARSGLLTMKPSGQAMPEPGDGLLFTGSAGYEEWGFPLNSMPEPLDRQRIRFPVPRPARPGMAVRLTASRELAARARQITASPLPDQTRRIPVDLCLIVDDQGRIAMSGTLQSVSGKEVRAEYRPDFALAEARTRPLTREALEAQVRKTGDTPFAVRGFAIRYAGGLFAPVSRINDMRREFFLRLQDALVASSRPGAGDLETARQRLDAWTGESPAPPEGRPDDTSDEPAAQVALTVYTDTPEAAAASVSSGCDCICFEPPSPDRVLAAQEIMDCCHRAGIRFVLKLPRITRDRELGDLLPAIGSLFHAGLTECRTDTAGAARAIRDRIPGMAFSGSGGLNVFNHEAACILARKFCSLVLSPELSRTECRDLVHAARAKGCTVPFGLVVQGPGEAMVTEDSLPIPQQDSGAGMFCGIRDTTGRIFPVRVDAERRTHIGNAVETCLIDQLPAIAGAGIAEVILDTRGRTSAYAGEMTSIWRRALSLVAGGAAVNDPQLLQLKVEAKARSLGGITSGHFLRGLRE